MKATNDLYSPVTGVVTDVNQALIDDPSLVNKDPYGAGWMVKVELSKPAEVESLLSAGELKAALGNQDWLTLSSLSRKFAKKTARPNLLFVTHAFRTCKKRYGRPRLIERISRSVYVECDAPGCCSHSFVETGEGIVMIDAPVVPSAAAAWANRDREARHPPLHYQYGAAHRSLWRQLLLPWRRRGPRRDERTNSRHTPGGDGANARRRGARQSPPP